LGLNEKQILEKDESFRVEHHPEPFSGPHSAPAALVGQYAPKPSLWDAEKSTAAPCVAEGPLAPGSVGVSSVEPFC